MTSHCNNSPQKPIEPYAFCEPRNIGGEVIAACNSGLYALTYTGEMKYKIWTGIFTDVCSNDELVVAVEAEKCEVHIFHLATEKWPVQLLTKSAREKWKSKHVFVLKNSENYLKNIHINCRDILISSHHWNHKVYKYSFDGKYQCEYSTSQGSRIGEFHFLL